MQTKQYYGVIETGFMPSSIQTIPEWTGSLGRHRGEAITPNGCRFHKDCFSCPENDCIYEPNGNKKQEVRINV